MKTTPNPSWHPTCCVWRCQLCLALTIVSQLACADSSNHHGAPAIARSSTVQAIDSSAIVVRGPTLIAFSPAATQEQIDSSEALTTVLDDYSYHLSTAADSLRALGVVVYERIAGPVRLIDPPGVRQLAPAPDSSRVAYAFVAPGVRDTIYYGVMASSELTAAAHALLQAVRRKAGTSPPPA